MHLKISLSSAIAHKTRGIGNMVPIRLAREIQEGEEAMPCMRKGDKLHSLSYGKVHSHAYPIYTRVTGSLCLSQASLGIKAGYTLDGVPTHRRAHTHTTDNLEMPINLQCMSLDQRRKPEENPRGTGRTCKLHTQMVEVGIKPPTLEDKLKSDGGGQSDLEKAYDRVPREELWYCMRKSGVAGKYVRVVQDMYERSRTVVRCAVGQTEEFNVEVGLHQGSALSPFLFTIVMDQLSEEVRQESPWTMMFADDIVICSESREQVEENLERWRFALERRGMKVSRSKTEYMCVNEREGSGTVRLQGEEVKKVQELKYLGSTVQSNGECGKEVKKRVQAGWNGWRKVSGVLCDQKISARIKGKVYRTVVRPAMLYGLETVSLRKRQESELEVAELKMLRFSLGVTRLDRIRNEYIRGTAHVGRLGDKVREARLRWFGHVQRRDSEYIGRRMLDMELPGRRQRGRPKRRYMDGINEDMKLVGARVEDAEDRDRWREMIRCGDP
ncbi:hypothetical protein QTP70_008601 [Hemibagrus guttatus]|uniref:ribonuclease H n=1 Tax=Hemibagrus guttatus TaxID=175788 RepID=A0AAE0QI13_9TELE|nr:hypothetical protein QTP70_008601 [Hemibagrus guttatus]